MPTIRTRQITSFLTLQKYSHRRKHSHAGNLSHSSAHKSKREPARNPESLGAGREGMNELGGGGGTGVSGGGRCSTGARKCVGESGASSSASEKNTKQRSALRRPVVSSSPSRSPTHTYTREPFSLFSRGLPVLIFTTTTSIMLLSSNSRFLLLASVLVIISGALASLGRTYTAHEIAKLELAHSCVLAARCLLGT